MVSKVGKETLAYCGSCKMDLNHTIVAMQGDRILKAQCRTCKKEHVFRAPKGVSDPGAQPPVREKAERAGTSREAARAAAKATPIEIEWEKRISASRGQPLMTYSARAVFKPGDRLAHPTFGEGVVSKLVHPNKIEVVFQMDLKILIHAGTA
jgi:hypothetical protein